MWMEKKVYDKSLEEEIRKRIAGKVDVQLGKKGITENFIREVKTRLEKHGVVKIRILKSYRHVSGMDRAEIARVVAERVGAKLVEVRGYTFILARAEKSKQRDKH